MFKKVLSIIIFFSTSLSLAQSLQLTNRDIQFSIEHEIESRLRLNVTSVQIINSSSKKVNFLGDSAGLGMPNLTPGVQYTVQSDVVVISEGTGYVFSCESVTSSTGAGILDSKVLNCNEK